MYVAILFSSLSVYSLSTWTKKMSKIPDEYNLNFGPPDIDSYLALRSASGLTLKTREQAAAGLHGAWYAAHIEHKPLGNIVAMGRVIGDGGWYFHIIDMAVLPEHQKKGLGNAILSDIINYIKTNAPPGAWVNLLADVPGRKLYQNHGFVETAPVLIGMEAILD